MQIPREYLNTEEYKVKKSLKYSIFDGSFYSVMVGFGESFFSAFAVFLNATSFQLGLLGSLPQFIGAICQLWSNKLIHFFKSRKKFILIGATIQGLMFLPMLLSYYFGELRVPFLILSICLYWATTVIGPAWNSWMGDLVPELERGSYFGRRNRITGVFSIFSMLAAGLLLEKYNANPFFGFIVLFLIAFIARIGSMIYLSKKYEPEYKIEKGTEFGFIEFLKKASFTNYGLFVFFLSMMNFGVYLSGPFFTPYMLNELHMNYWIFSIVTVTSLASKFLFMPLWGKACDRYGTRKVLALSSFIMPLTPILWIFSNNLWYLLLIQVYSGFVWAGFEISSFNFIFDTTSAPKRATCVAYYNVLNGIFMLLGGIVGGIMMRHDIAIIFGSAYFFIFAASGVLRYIAVLIFIPKLKEARDVERIPYTKLLYSIITTMPTIGIMHNIITFYRKK